MKLLRGHGEGLVVIANARESNMGMVAGAIDHLQEVYVVREDGKHTV